jgi:hypothetical protein
LSETSQLFGLTAESVPFVDGYFLQGFCRFSMPLAVAFGLWQTLAESIHGTYPFLFHRPVRRGWLIGVKLLVGMAMCLGCGAAPILVYGLWAATPGSHASPFEWSMTLPCWMIWLDMTLLYLGAFLTGLRPGRWYRSRLLPLVAAAAVVMLAESGFIPEASPWPWVIVLAADGWMAAMILFVARTRDYP